MKEHSGDRVVRWTLLSRERLPSGRLGWRCRCDCGNEAVILPNKLRSGLSQSCGCLKSEKASQQNYRHGTSCTPTHRTWMSMIQRCTNPNNTKYADYGGRGVTVCERWQIFEVFLQDMGERPDGTSLDRLDNHRGYEPGNCAWSTTRQQARNKRSNRLLTLNGETLCLTDWANKAGLPHDVLASRVRRGWSIERALTQAVAS